MGTDRSPEHINGAVKEISEGAALATEQDVRNAADIKDGTTYMKDDTFTADPSVALGQVFVSRVGSEASVPFVFPIDVTIDQSTLLKAPLVRGEVIVDAAASATVDVLSLASLELGAKDVAELHIIDNYSARAHTGPDWRVAVRDWRAYPESKDLLEDVDVQSVSVVVGVVQKYITVKRYTEYSGSATVAAYGVNVGGKLFTSTSSFRLEIIYGLSLVELSRSTPKRESEIATPATLQSLQAWARNVKTPVRMIARAKGR